MLNLFSPMRLLKPLLPHISHTIKAPKQPRTDLRFHHDVYDAHVNIRRQHQQSCATLDVKNMSLSLPVHRIGTPVAAPNAPVTVVAYWDGGSDVHNDPHDPGPYTLLQQDGRNITNMPLFAQGPMQAPNGLDVADDDYLNSWRGAPQTTSDIQVFQAQYPDVHMQMSMLDRPQRHWADLLNAGVDDWIHFFESKKTSPEETGFAGIDYDNETVANDAQWIQAGRWMTIFGRLYYGTEGTVAFTAYTGSDLDRQILQNPITQNEFAMMQYIVANGANVHPTAKQIVAQVSTWLQNGVQMPLSVLINYACSMNYSTPIADADIYAPWMSINAGGIVRDGYTCTFPGFRPDYNNLPTGRLAFPNGKLAQGGMEFQSSAVANNPNISNPTWWPQFLTSLDVGTNPNQCYSIPFQELLTAAQSKDCVVLDEKSSSFWVRCAQQLGIARWRHRYFAIPTHHLPSMKEAPIRDGHFIVPEMWVRKHAK